MIPLFGEVNVSWKDGNGPRKLWVPLFPFWLLFWPLLILALPLILVTCLLLEVDPVDAVAAIWRVLSSLRGTNVTVHDEQFDVQVSIS